MALPIGTRVRVKEHSTALSLVGFVGTVSDRGNSLTSRIEFDHSRWNIVDSTLEILSVPFVIGERVIISYERVSNEIRGIFHLQESWQGSGVVITDLQADISYQGHPYLLITTNENGAWHLPVEALYKIEQLENNSSTYMSDTAQPNDVSYTGYVTGIGSLGIGSSVSVTSMGAQTIINQMNSLKDFYNLKTSSGPFPTRHKIVKARVMKCEDSGRIFGRKSLRLLLAEKKTICVMISHDENHITKEHGVVDCYRLRTPFGIYRFLASDVEILPEPKQTPKKDREIKPDTYVKFKTPRLASKYRVAPHFTYKVTKISKDPNQKPKEKRGHDLVTIELPDRTTKKIWFDDLKRV